MKLSIIIPIYNAAKALHRCLDSVLYNNLKDFECICVDDCSTDDSVEIVEEYIKKDIRFKLIKHETNQGVSAARNSGLLFSSGEWIGFIDSDDYIHPDRFIKTIEAAEKSNIKVCACSSKVLTKNKTKYWFKYNGILNVDNIYQNTDLAAVTNVIYKKEIIKDVFFRNINYAEDLLFNFEILSRIDKVLFIPDSFYIHDETYSILSKTISKDKIMKAYNMFKIYLKDSKYYNYFHKNLCKRNYFKDYPELLN